MTPASSKHSAPDNRKVSFIYSHTNSPTFLSPFTERTSFILAGSALAACAYTNRICSARLIKAQYSLGYIATFIQEKRPPIRIEGNTYGHLLAFHDECPHPSQLRTHRSPCKNTHHVLAHILRAHKSTITGKLPFLQKTMVQPALVHLPQQLLTQSTKAPERTDTSPSPQTSVSHSRHSLQDPGHQEVHTHTHTPASEIYGEKNRTSSGRFTSLSLRRRRAPALSGWRPHAARLSLPPSRVHVLFLSLALLSSLLSLSRCGCTVCCMRVLCARPLLCCLLCTHDGGRYGDMYSSDPELQQHSGVSTLSPGQRADLT